MVKYTSQYQTKIIEFGTLRHLNLNEQNRWIQLGFCLPWDELVKIYSKRFSDSGAGTINPRYVIGAFIIKHIDNYTDDGTIQIISENPYMQFFLGLEDFTPERLFSPTLFVELRKRLGLDCFNEFTDLLIKQCFPHKIKKASEGKSLPNKGKLKLDATVADQYISYPTDLNLLNEGRQKLEAIIDELYEHVRLHYKAKPRTYRRTAHKKYLTESKKRQTNPKTLRSAIRFMLNCLDRNLKYINEMLALLKQNPLKEKQMDQIAVIEKLNKQQRKMYDEKTNRCDDRIVSISQPHVRPIKRGKKGRKTEFGSKLGLMLMLGFTKLGNLKWDAYNESADLIVLAKAYKELFGYYPELIQIDKIYGTNENRKWCKANDIRLTVSSKGPKKKLSAYENKKRKKEYAERNAVEGKIGQAKQGYRLNQVKAKLKETSECWIACTLFVTNIVRFAELNGFCI